MTWLANATSQEKQELRRSVAISFVRVRNLRKSAQGERRTAPVMEFKASPTSVAKAVPVPPFARVSWDADKPCAHLAYVSKTRHTENSTNRHRKLPRLPTRALPYAKSKVAIHLSELGE